MPEQTAAQRVDSYSELVPHISISRVQFYEVHARSTPEQHESAKSIEGEQIESDVDLQLSRTPEVLAMRVRFETELESGTVVVDGAMFFHYDEPLEVSEEVALDFVNITGFMTYVPYLRQMVEDISGRTFPAPLRLPLLQRGTFHFGPPAQETDQEDAVQTVNEDAPST